MYPIDKIQPRIAAVACALAHGGLEARASFAEEVKAIAHMLDQLFPAWPKDHCLTGGALVIHAMTQAICAERAWREELDRRANFHVRGIGTDWKESDGEKEARLNMGKLKLARVMAESRPWSDAERQALDKAMREFAETAVNDSEIQARIDASVRKIVAEMQAQLAENMRAALAETTTKPAQAKSH